MLRLETIFIFFSFIVFFHSHLPFFFCCWLYIVWLLLFPFFSLCWHSHDMQQILSRNIRYLVSV
jgi:hypothetical protein